MKYEISNCERNNLCVDCNDGKCIHAGKIYADCPKYKCDSYSCENCSFIKEYQNLMRAKLAEMGGAE